MNKNELIENLEDSRQDMLELLEDLPDEMLLKPGVIGEWSIKDTLAHLSYWEGQIITLLFQVQRGMETPSTAHFGKETVDQVNQRWFEGGKERTLEMVWADWLGVRKQTVRRVSEMDEQLLNDTTRFSWQRGEPLWQWVANDSYEHEQEHGDAIREWLDQQEQAAQNNGHNPNA